jgi:hypothetical protein
MRSLASRPLSRSSHFHRVASVALCGLLCQLPRQVAAQDSAPARAAKPTTYRLSGVVLDSARAPVPDAEVSVIQADAIRRQVVSGADGRFTLASAKSCCTDPPVRVTSTERVTLPDTAGSQRHRASDARGHREPIHAPRRPPWRLRGEWEFSRWHRRAALPRPRPSPSRTRSSPPAQQRRRGTARAARTRDGGWNERRNDRLS